MWTVQPVCHSLPTTTPLCKGQTHWLDREASAGSVPFMQELQGPDCPAETRRGKVRLREASPLDIESSPQGQAMAGGGTEQVL